MVSMASGPLSEEEEGISFRVEQKVEDEKMEREKAL